MYNTIKPWVEKYRPDTLEDIVLDDTNKTIVKNIIGLQLFPNILLYGPPGTGKTTTILNLITDFQKCTTGYNKGRVIHLNASDERGVDIIRNLIMDFVNTNGLFQNGLKFVILDEVDSMTKSAQQALKILIQNIKTPTRFCLITNYISRVDASLRNYCLSMRFNQLPPEQILTTLNKINISEKVGLAKQSLHYIQLKYNSDMRSMINYMQTMQTNMKNILTTDVLNEVLVLFKKNINSNKITRRIESIIKKYGINIIEFMRELFNYIIREHIMYITPRFLKMVNEIMQSRCSNQNNIIPFFIFNMRELHNSTASCAEFDISQTS
tara:strand:+ start:730 stop:1701 length:972 start_codon:yes stop_codon:yes gene_type:complete